MVYGTSFLNIKLCVYSARVVQNALSYHTWCIQSTINHHWLSRLWLSFVTLCERTSHGSPGHNELITSRQCSYIAVVDLGVPLAVAVIDGKLLESILQFYWYNAPKVTHVTLLWVFHFLLKNNSIAGFCHCNNCHYKNIVATHKHHWHHDCTTSLYPTKLIEYASWESHYSPCHLLTICSMSTPTKFGSNFTFE